MQVKVVSALENKEPLIRFKLYEKVQQVHKRMKTDNDGRTGLHWFRMSRRWEP